jgi:hypothetical protein
MIGSHMIKARRIAPHLLVVACVIANGLQLHSTIYAYVQSNDLVQAWEDRMLPVRQALPRDVYVSGYQQNSDIPEIAAIDDPNGFFMSQYAAAPVVLMPAFGQEWTVGYFRGLPIRSVRALVGRRLEMFTIQDFGSGFYLIHRSGK